MAGPERKSRVISEREKRVIAYHEGGHALVAHALPNTDPGAQDLDHPARPRARLHAHAAHRGQVPRHAQRAGRRARDAARRPHGRGADLRRPHHRRAERHRPRHHDRPADGHRVRHERGARSAAVRPAAGRGVPRPRLHQPRPTTPTRSRPASTPRCAGSSSTPTRCAREILEANRDILDRLADELVEHETLEVERVQELFADVRAVHRLRRAAAPARPRPAPTPPGAPRRRRPIRRDEHRA